MAAILTEDIEILQKKGNIGYMEAAEILESHQGNLALALLELEKKEILTEKISGNVQETGKKFPKILTGLFRFRIHVFQGERNILNVSLLLIVILALCGYFLPKLMLPLVVVLFLVTGCRIRIKMTDEELDTDQISRNFRTAGDKIRRFAGKIMNRLNKDRR